MKPGLVVKPLVILASAGLSIGIYTLAMKLLFGEAITLDLYGVMRLGILALPSSALGLLLGSMGIKRGARSGADPGKVEDGAGAVDDRHEELRGILEDVIERLGVIVSGVEELKGLIADMKREEFIDGRSGDGDADLGKGRSMAKAGPIDRDMEDLYKLAMDLKAEISKARERMRRIEKGAKALKARERFGRENG